LRDLRGQRAEGTVLSLALVPSWNLQIKGSCSGHVGVLGLGLGLGLELEGEVEVEVELVLVLVWSTLGAFFPGCIAITLAFWHLDQLVVKVTAGLWAICVISKV
jgi:hypothetical protein